MRRPGVSTRTYLGALFALYLALLVWIVLWKLEVPFVGTSRVIKLVPFIATGDAGASNPFEVAANLALFAPFGIYLGVLAPRLRWWGCAGILAAASLALETTQYVLAVGRSDVTDVIVNTIGGLVGLALLGLVRSRLRARTVSIMMVLCTIGTTLALLATGLFVISGVHLVHVGDVGPLARVHVLKGH